MWINGAQNILSFSRKRNFYAFWLLKLLKAFINNVFFTDLRLHHRGKIPSTGIFDPKKPISPAQGKIPSTGIFCENSISPVQGQSLTHRGTLKNFKVPTHHTTEPTRRRTLKISKYPHATQHKADTPGNFDENFQSLYTPQSPHTREL